MNQIAALIIDDEVHNRNVLRALLETYCPQLQIEGEAGNALEAYALIKNTQPRLVFLDVNMPQKSGFDLLKMFDAIDFEVIFVSAFNEFAVNAFDFNALGYILKPIDYTKLIIAVNRALVKIESRQKNELQQFINTLEPKTDIINKLSLHHNEKVVLVNIVEIVSISAKEGICQVKLADNKQYYSSKDLKLFDGILKKLGNFVRINKNVILNLAYLESYQKGDPCVLNMINNSEFEVSRRKKAEVLSRIRLH